MARDNRSRRHRRNEHAVDCSLVAVRIATRYFGRVETIQEYAARVNAGLPARSPRIVLLRENETQEHPAYVRLLARLVIAWPDAHSSSLMPPRGISEGLSVRPGTVPHIEIISRVIADALRKNPDRFEAQNRNVLTNGFVLGRPNGPGSIFRNLDLRATSGSVNVLTSPPWRLLFERIGHVAAKHLLDNAALLLALELRESVAKIRPSIALVQLSGPTPLQQSNKFQVPLPTSVVQMKRDVLYRGPCSIPRSNRRRGSQRIQVNIVSGKKRARDDDSDRDKTDHAPLNKGLPSSHILQSLQAESQQDLIRLFGNIFPAYAKGAPSTSIYSDRRPTKRRLLHNEVPEAPADRRISIVRVPPRMKSLLPLLGAMLSRTAKRSFRAVLSEVCPLNKDQNPFTSQRQLTIEELVTLRTKPARVAKFLIRVCRQVVPLKLLGSRRNRKLFDDAVRKLVRHRGLYENMDLRGLFSKRGMKITDIIWLYRSGDNGSRICNPTDLRFRQERLLDMLTWLFRDLCLPVLHQSLYVTESEMSRNRVVYYRREVWTIVHDLMFRKMLKTERRMLTLLSPAGLANSLRRREELLARSGLVFCPYPIFNFGGLRFLPKACGARGIQRPRVKLLHGFLRRRNVKSAAATCSQLPCLPTSTIIERARLAMKSFYGNVLEILSSESRAAPEVLGSSVFSPDEIYSKVSKFVRNWKRAGRPRLYFVCTDVSKSFDTVPHDTLLKHVIPAVLTKERYVILRYIVVKRHVSSKELRYRFCLHVCQEPGEEGHFPRLVREALGELHPEALFIDLVSVSTVLRSDLVAVLTDCLSNNIVSIPPRLRSRSKYTAYALQCVGVPQGCPLSPILASLFYAFVERQDLSAYLDGNNVFPSCKGKGGPLFMRHVDDTIFVCASESVTRSLASRMTQGWDDAYGFSINTNKTRMNFDAGTGGLTNLRHIQWCGYNFDSETMEISRDYDRYVSNECRVRDFLKIVHGIGAVPAFLRKASSCFIPNIHAILLDRNINSLTTIVLNIYEASAFSALKLCSYSLELFPRRRRGADPNSPHFFCRVVNMVIQRFCVLVRVRTKSSAAIRNECKFPFTENEVRFIVTRAFRDVLTKKLRVWYARQAQSTTAELTSDLRYHSTRTVVQDLELKYKTALRTASSGSLWKLNL